MEENEENVQEEDLYHEQKVKEGLEGGKGRNPEDKVLTDCLQLKNRSQKWLKTLALMEYQRMFLLEKEGEEKCMVLRIVSSVEKMLTT